LSASLGIIPATPVNEAAVTDDETLHRVALAIYCASSPFSMVTIYDAMKMAEAAIAAMKAAEETE
jgi:hypothetical protein